LRAADPNGLPALRERISEGGHTRRRKGLHDAVVRTTTHVDTFGNRCLRLVAPPGDLTIWGDATIEDDGKIDPANFAAVELPVAELPDSCLLYLMGSRYCETDKLSQTAWDLFGKVRPG
jgi:hypothetical protein